MKQTGEMAGPSTAAEPRPSRVRALVLLILLHAASVGLVWLAMNAAAPDGSNRGVPYERLRLLDAEVARSIAIGAGLVLSLLAGRFVRASGCLVWAALAGGYLTWSVLDANQYGGHNLLPFEWAVALFCCLPLFVLVMIGRALGAIGR